MVVYSYLGKGPGHLYCHIKDPLGGKYDKSIKSAYRDLNAASYFLRNGLYTKTDDINTIVKNSSSSFVTDPTLVGTPPNV